MWRSLRTDSPLKKIIFITARYVRCSDVPKELKDPKNKLESSSRGPQLRVGVEGVSTGEPRHPARPALTENEVRENSRVRLYLHPDKS